MHKVTNIQLRHLSFYVLRWYTRPVKLSLIKHLYQRDWQVDLLNDWCKLRYLLPMRFEDDDYLYLSDDGLKYITHEIFKDKLPFNFVRTRNLKRINVFDTYFVSGVDYIKRTNEIKTIYVKSFDLDAKTFDTTYDVTEAYHVESNNWRQIKLIIKLFGVNVRKFEILRE